MTSIRPALGSGLITMGAVALAAAIWPNIAAAVSIVFVSVLVIAASVPTLLGVRWVESELAWRQELRAMTPTEERWAAVSERDVPALAQLRGSA